MSRTGRACIAEAIGTFALCFIGAGSIVLNTKTGGAVGLIGIALAHGLILSVMISALGGVSGGHFNPAVTIGFLVTKKQEVGAGISYIISQLIGATDKNGESPTDDTKISPDDLAATLYHTLGIDPLTEYFTKTNRPAMLVPEGRVMTELLA